MIAKWRVVMSNFDDILKKGKDKATGESIKQKDWRKLINSVMDDIHALNSLYDNDKYHHVNLEPIDCKKCRNVSFVLAIRDMKNSKKLNRFHKSKWQAVKKGVYNCDKCK